MPKIPRSAIKALAVHEAVARDITANPSLREVAKRRLTWLRQKNPYGKPYHDAWQALLDGPLDVLLKAMVAQDPDSCQLRQEAPFGDLIDQKLRAQIHRDVIHRLAAETFNAA